MVIRDLGTGISNPILPLTHLVIFDKLLNGLLFTSPKRKQRKDDMIVMLYIIGPL